MKLLNIAFYLEKMGIPRLGKPMAKICIKQQSNIT